MEKSLISFETIIEKYFGEEDVFYYQTDDIIADDQFIRYSYYRNNKNKIGISIGSNEGECVVKLFTDPKELDKFIQILIF